MISHYMTTTNNIACCRAVVALPILLKHMLTPELRDLVITLIQHELAEFVLGYQLY